MKVREELRISKPLYSGHEIALALLLTREYVVRLQDQRLFRPEDISDQQYNVLRILRGGPEEGYLIKDLRPRMIYRFADVPRLVNRLVVQKLVTRGQCPSDRRGSRVKLTAKGLETEARIREKLDSLCESMDRCLSGKERDQLLTLLERLRDDYRSQLGESKE
jgi:DNA-binding MarR family transcriptional regulator